MSYLLVGIPPPFLFSPKAEKKKEPKKKRTHPLISECFDVPSNHSPACPCWWLDVSIPRAYAYVCTQAGRHTHRHRQVGVYITKINYEFVDDVDAVIQHWLLRVSTPRIRRQASTGSVTSA